MIEKLSSSSGAAMDISKNKNTFNLKGNSDNQQDQFMQQQEKEKAEKIMNSMNDFLKASNTHLKFEFHEGLQEYYVAVVDDITNEVVKEIPPKKFLDMYAAMTKCLGLLIDRKV